MNTSYPENTVDSDEEFVYVSCGSIFNLDEIDKFLANDDLRSFNSERLKFVKSKDSRENFLSYHCNVTFFDFFFDILTEIYSERVQDNKKRFNAFKKHLRSALLQYKENMKKRNGRPQLKTI